MAILEFSNKAKQLNFGKDDIITQKWIAGIKGGRALDVTDYPLDVIYAGTPVIVKDGNYKPFPLVQKTETVDEETVPVVDENGNPVYELGTLPANHSYAGILYKSILKTKPAASIMTQGQVNDAAMYFDFSSIKSAFKSACPLIEFVQDEVATAND